VGLASEGYVDNLVSISTFSGDYNDLSNQPSIPTNISDLSDINVGSPSTGQVLKWSGTEWIASADLVGEGGTGIGLSDLSLTINPAGINSLSYNNTTGVFQFTPTSLVGLASEGYVDTLVSISTFSGDYNDLSNTPSIPSIAGLASEGYVDNLVAISTFSGDYNDLSNQPSIPSITGLASEGYVDNLVAISTFSGDYNDLLNQPSIPSIVGLASEGYVDAAIAEIPASDVSYWNKTASGIHTLSNVGVGTTNPTSALTVKGNTSLETLSVSGVSTFWDKIEIGSSADIEYSQPDLTIRSTYTNGSVILTGPGGVDIETYGGQLVAHFDSNPANIGSVDLYYNGSKKFETLGDGVTVTGTTFTNQLSVSGVSTFNNDIEISGDVVLGTGNNNRILIDNDLEIYSTSLDVFLRTPTSENIYISNINDTMALFKASDNGQVELYYDGNKKFETTSDGVTVTGITFTDHLSVSGISTFNDDVNIGTGITFYASTGIVSATTFYGDLIGSITDATNLTGGYAQASSLIVSGITTISQGRIQANADANLRFGNLPTGSGSVRNIAIGDQVLNSLSGGSGRNIGIGELSYYNTTSGQYNIGIGVQAGQNITTGSYNVIIGAYNGETGLDIRTSSNNVVIADGEGNIRQYIDSSGNVGIKTTIITEALTVAGIVSATSFYGTLNAEQLTGTLPALDGSALLGVVATNSGIEIRENDSPLGVAATINFGNNIDVSLGSGIATVSTSLVGYATESYVDSAIVGFITSGALNGYATENYVSSASVAFASISGISSSVSNTININTSGIITATTFSGSGSGLTNLSAGELSGTLPALDGSALINLPAQPGDGINVQDNDSTVGSARTVNFGSGLEVQYDASAGIATINSTGGSLKSRTVVSGSTTSIANNGIGNTDITGFKSYTLMKVGLSTAGWLRIYTDSASRDADVSRSVGEDPLPGSGVIAEVVTTGISTTQIISPFVNGGNLDEPASTTIYASIKNLSGSTQAITANLTILQLEE
jgi:hypothetical protein